jgi:hypothetical protein
VCCWSIRLALRGESGVQGINPLNFLRVARSASPRGHHVYEHEHSHHGSVRTSASSRRAKPLDPIKSSMEISVRIKMSKSSLPIIQLPTRRALLRVSISTCDLDVEPGRDASGCFNNNTAFTPMPSPYACMRDRAVDAGASTTGTTIEFHVDTRTDYIGTL